MKKTKILNRIISIVLVVILSFSGINPYSVKGYKALAAEAALASDAEAEGLDEAAEDNTALETSDDVTSEISEDEENNISEEGNEEDVPEETVEDDAVSEEEEASEAEELPEEVEIVDEEELTLSEDAQDVTVTLAFPKGSFFDTGSDTYIDIYLKNITTNSSRSLYFDSTYSGVDRYDTADGVYNYAMDEDIVRLDPGEYNVYYKISSSAITNLHRDKYIYITEDGFSTSSEDAAAIEIIDSVTIPLLMADFYGTVYLPEEYYTENSSESREIRITAQTESQNYSTYLYLSSDHDYGYYQFNSLPLGTDELKGITAYVYSNSNTALAYGYDEYLHLNTREDESDDSESRYYSTLSGKAEDASVIKKADITDDQMANGALDFTLLTARVKYTIRLPEDYVADKNNSNYSGYIYSYYAENNYKSVYYRIPKGETELVVYADNFPVNYDTLYGTRITVDSRDDYLQNITTGTDLYYSEDKLVGTKTLDGAALSDDTILERNLTLRTAPVKVTVKLPENAIVGNNTSEVTGYFYYNDGSSRSKYFKIKTDKRECSFYLNQMNPDVTSITNVNIKLSNSNGNLAYNSNEYYNGTDTLVHDNPNYTLNLSETGETALVLTPWVIPLRVRVNLPEGVVLPEGSSVSGYIYATYATNKYESIYFTIPAGETSVEVSVNGVPADATEILNLRIKVNSSYSGLTNLVLNRDEYYAGGTSMAYNSSDAISFAMPSDALDVTLAKTPAHFRLKLGDGVFFKGGNLSGTFYVKNSSNNTYSKSISIQDGQDSIEFYLNDYDWTNRNIVETRYNWSTNNSLMTNIFLGQTLYYNGSSFDTSNSNTAYTIPADSITELPISKAKNLVPIKIKLPAGSSVLGANLTGTLDVYYVSASSSTFKRNGFVLEPGESETIAYVALPDDYPIPGNIYGIRYNVSKKDEVGSNIVYNKDYWYNGNTCSTSQVRDTIAVSGSPIVINLVSGKSISGKILLPEGTYVKNSPVKGYIRGRIGSSYYSYYFTTPVDAEEIPYTIALPEDSTSISFFEIYFYNNNDAATNIPMNYTMYLGNNGIVDSSADAEEIDVSGNVTTTKDFTIKKYASISGSITMPSGYYVSEYAANDYDAYITVTAYDDQNRSFSRDIKIYSEDLKNEYEYKITASNFASKEFKYLTVRMNPRNNVLTDIVRDQYYVTEEGSLVSTRYELNGLNIENREDINVGIRMLRVPTLKGKIRLPEDAYLGSAKVSVTLCAFCYGSSLGSSYKSVNSIQYTLSGDEAREYEYKIPLVYGTERVGRLYAYVSNTSTSNLYSGYHYRISNTESSYDYADADVNVSGYSANADITLISLKAVKGTITLPTEENLSEGKLNARLSAVNQNNTSGDNVTVSINSDTRKADFTCLLPVGSEKLNYFNVYFTTDSSDTETDVMIQKTMYVDAQNTWLVDYRNAEPVDVNDIPETIELIYPQQRTISGTISVEELGIIRNGSLTLDITAHTDADDSSVELDKNTLVFDSKDDTVNYSLKLPVLASRVTYLEIEGVFDGEEGDCNLYVIDQNCYIGDDLRFRPESGLCTPIMLNNDSVQKDLVLEAKRTISGKIIIPDGARIDQELSGYLSFNIGGYAANHEFSVSSISDELEYEIELPSGSSVIDSVYVNLSGSDISTNLVLGTVYYNATEDKWFASSLNATTLPVTAAENTFDVILQRRVTLSGKISLPEGGYFENAAINGYVRADIGETAVSGYFTIEPGSTETNYEIIIPSEAEQIDKVTIFVYANSLLNSNVLTGKFMYVTENGWAEEEETALVIFREEKFEIIKDLELPISRTISGVISRSDLGEELDGSVTVYNSETRYSTSFSLKSDEYSTTYRISMPDNEDREYKLSYDIGTQYIEDYITDEVFVKEDGTYSLTAEFVEPSIMADAGTVRDFALADWSCLRDDALLGSPHPYANDGAYTMHYEYPGTADGLEITFTENTHFEDGFDDFYLMDKDGHQLEHFTGAEAAGKTVTIPVTEVDFVIDADPSNTSYGFGIKSIKAVNGVLRAEPAASTVYENDIATFAVIHSSDEAQKNFYMSVANYNGDGKMLSSVNKKLCVEGNMSVVSLDIQHSEESDQGKIMLYSEDLVPLMDAKFKIYAAYTVTFHYNDAVDGTRVVYVAENNYVPKPTVDPSNEGYKFIGWYKDPELTTPYDFGETIISSTSIYAKWEKIYEVRTNTSGSGKITTAGLVGMYSSAGQEITLIPDADEGSVFKDWYIESGLESGSYTIDENGKLSFVMPENDVVVKVYFVDEVDVTWTWSSVMASDGETQEEVMRLPYDHRLVVPADIEKVSLKGNVPLDKQISSVFYVYNYFTIDDDGKEIYVNGDQTALSYDDAGAFEFNDLVVGAGSNYLAITFVYTDGTQSTVEYFIIGTQDDLRLSDAVNEMDLYDMTDMAFVENLATGIDAYWNTDEGFTVLIVDKQSEMATRLLSEEGTEGHIDIGSIWIIPSCDQFPTGYTFKIMDFGNSEYAPDPLPGDLYEGQVFSSEKYIYILAGEPDVTEMIGNNSFALTTDGIDGIAFTLLPENSVMNFDLEQEDGSSVMATAGAFSSPGEVTHAGWQFQNLARNLIPRASVKSNKVGLSFEFADTVLYDKDGSKNTEWDRLSLGGSLNMKDFGVEGAFEWHPDVDLDPIFDGDGMSIDLLPQQIGLLADYTFTQTVKFSIGGTFGGNPEADTDNGEPNNSLSLGGLVDDFKDSFGCSNNKRDISLLGLDIGVEGVDMDSSIVLGAVGFTLAPVTTVGGTYENVQKASTVEGLVPVLCLMFLMDLDGNISGKITYQYSKSSYNAKGFNITRWNFNETNAKIKYQTPSEDRWEGDYHIKYFNTEQASEWDSSKALGKHTITVDVEATFLFDIGVAVGLMVWGINVAQIKGAAYVEASAGASGSVSYQEGSNFSIGDGIDGVFSGYLNFGAGLLAQASARIYAKTWLGDPGFDASWEGKWEVASWGISSIGISGTITTPSLMENVADQPLEGVEVKLTERNAVSEPIVTKTDANGKYSFKNLSPDTSYNVELVKQGYVQKKEKAEDSRIDVGKTTIKKKNFTMSKNIFFGLTGEVESAETHNKITTVNITLTNLSNNTVKYAKTDNTGTYLVGKSGDASQGLTPAYYKMVVSAPGYKTVSKKILINGTTASTIHVEKIQMLKGSGDGDCMIKGYIYDLATGQSTGVKLTLYLRRGLDSTTGRILQTYELSADGMYAFNVPVGNYTIQVKDTRLFISDANKYDTTNFNVIASSNSADQVQNGYVSTSSSSDQVRIVLTWGKDPSDLDSHLVGPDARGTGKFHTYYSNKVYSYNNTKYDDLDLDDTSSYGPETTTIYRKSLNGTYSFYIHDYSNRSSNNSYEMSQSGATVKVYIGSRLMATYNVPRNRMGTLWHVFDYNPVTNALIEKGQVYNHADPANVGLTSVALDESEEPVVDTSLDDLSEDERENIMMIFNDLEEK